MLGFREQFLNVHFIYFTEWMYNIMGCPYKKKWRMKEWINEKWMNYLTNKHKYIWKKLIEEGINEWEWFNGWMEDKMSWMNN